MKNLISSRLEWFHSIGFCHHRSSYSDLFLKHCRHPFVHRRWESNFKIIHRLTSKNAIEINTRVWRTERTIIRKSNVRMHWPLKRHVSHCSINTYFHQKMFILMVSSRRTAFWFYQTFSINQISVPWGRYHSILFQQKQIFCSCTVRYVRGKKKAWLSFVLFQSLSTYS